MLAAGCRCVEGPLTFSDEPAHCSRCGRGPCRNTPYRGERPGRPFDEDRLPLDLGAVQREGRHPDLGLENVVRLDRLREPGVLGTGDVVMSVPAVRAVGRGLTSREAEVLGLVADGLSNVEIAARLAVSQQTVKFHVGNVLGKVGARNRVEAARWWWVLSAERSEDAA